jgi:hypothetical protein
MALAHERGIWQKLIDGHIKKLSNDPLGTKLVNHYDSAGKKIASFRVPLTADDLSAAAAPAPVHTPAPVAPGEQAPSLESDPAVAEMEKSLRKKNAASRAAYYAPARGDGDVLQQARAAIQAGADPAAVKARLAQMGVDSSGL